MYNREKSFGFITSDEGVDVFFSTSRWPSSVVAALAPGKRVKYDTVIDKSNKNRAVKVRLIDEIPIKQYEPPFKLEQQIGVVLTSSGTLIFRRLGSSISNSIGFGHEFEALCCLYEKENPPGITNFYDINYVTLGDLKCAIRSNVDCMLTKKTLNRTNCAKVNHAPADPEDFREYEIVEFKTLIGLTDEALHPDCGDRDLI
eukprot:GHVH01002120.1.p2 GENE.GHVH01002120.1~~GHVH01002120.1.p2  ORF type:complete len:201 (-),score=32.45 GHVH01002120.1:491-1093(-)